MQTDGRKQKFGREDLPKLEVSRPRPPTVAGGVFAFLTKLASPSVNEYQPIEQHDDTLKRSSSLGEDDPEFQHRINKFSSNVLKSQSLGHLSFSMLSIPEKILLTVVSDQASVRSGLDDIERVLLWGVLCELIIAEKITTYELRQNPNKKATAKRFGLDVVSTHPIGVGLFDEVLQKINFRYQAKKNTRIETVMNSIYKDVSKTLMKRVLHMLMDRGIVKKSVVDLLVVNFDSFVVQDTIVRQHVMTEIIGILTKVEDRYHQNMSPTTPIRGLSLQMYALISLMYNHDNILFIDVLQKYFADDENAQMQLKHTAGEMVQQYQLFQRSWGEENLYTYLYRVIQEFIM
jgi:hypothetical protein